MGGNIFKNSHKVLRLSKKEYDNYCTEIISLFDLLALTNNTDYKIIEAIREKETFGDMDIVVNNKISLTFIKVKLKRYGYPVSKNGNVLSFLYNGFQIDLIFVDDSIFDYAYNYFCWSDVGNIIGRLAKQYGLKHGWNGLYYIQRNGDHIIKEHLLSTNYYDVLKCMYLDPIVFSKGFDTYLDMFNWAVDTPRFMPEIFKLENLNHINRVRDKKRKTYNMFLSYLESIDKERYLGNFKLTSEEKRECVCRWFPFVRNEIEKCEEENNKLRIIKSKFNGSIVNSLTNLSGKELGGFITDFKSKHNNEWLYKTPSWIISSTIKEFYNGTMEKRN